MNLINVDPKFEYGIARRREHNVAAGSAIYFNFNNLLIAQKSGIV